jgi:Trypsin-like peptidase domain
MHAHAGRLLFVPLLLLSNAPPVRAACVDPAQLAHSAVSTMRHFDDHERDDRPNLIGVRGTGWFLSPTTIVTAEHVTAGMKLSTEEWKPLEIMDGDSSQFISARIQRLAGAQAERLAVIELERAVSDARSVTIRKEPLVPEEQVITLTYPAGRLQLVSGRFVRFGDDGKLTGMALLEFYEGDNRLIIDHGASGAPVIDCSGRVAAVVSNVFTQTIQWTHSEIRISTAWGTPNVVSVPAQVLDDFSKPALKVLQLNSSAAYANSVDGGAGLLR